MKISEAPIWKRILLWFKPISWYSILIGGGIIWGKELFGYLYESHNTFDKKEIIEI